MHIIEATAVYIASNQILLNEKDHQMLFVGGPENMRRTNPRWRTAAMLKNR